jgi:phosphate transport system permease protein
MRDDRNLNEIRTIIARHKLWDFVFMIVGIFALMIAMLTFMALFSHMLIDGLPRLSWDFFTSFPSRRPASAGILSAWVGTTLVMLVTAIAAVPMGMGA